MERVRRHYDAIKSYLVPFFLLPLPLYDLRMLWERGMFPNIKCTLRKPTAYTNKKIIELAYMDSTPIQNFKSNFTQKNKVLKAFFGHRISETIRKVFVCDTVECCVVYCALSQRVFKAL